MALAGDLRGARARARAHPSTESRGMRWELSSGATSSQRLRPASWQTMLPMGSLCRSVRGEGGGAPVAMNTGTGVSARIETGAVSAMLT